MIPPDPQDAYSQLVEECRIGQVTRVCFQANGRNIYRPCKPDIDLNLPVFFFGELSPHVEHDRWDTLIAAMKALEFRLPYPRCAMMYRVSSDNLAFSQGYDANNVPHQYRRTNGRYYLVTAEQETETSWFLQGFTSHDNQQHWMVSSWQSIVHQDDNTGEVLVSMGYDVEATKHATADFWPLYEASSRQRVLNTLSELHRITTQRGHVTAAKGRDYTTKADTRRSKLGLPPIPRIRIIDFDAAPSLPVPQPSSGKGVQRVPHYRRGTWRNLQSGKVVWVSPSAIHGGTPDVPPWYHVKG